MKFSNVYIFNILVHYGVDKESVFIDMVDEGVFDFIINDPDLVFRKKEQFLEELQIISSKSSYYLFGKFSKQFDFHTDRVKESNERKNKIIDVESLPYSFFYLDLVNHRIVWIKPRGITGAPDIESFCSYLKRKAGLYFNQKYYTDAVEAYDMLKAGGEVTFSKRKFISDYLKENGVRYRDIEVKALSIIDRSAVEDIIRDENTLVKSIKLKIYKPNATDRDIEGAKGDFDKIAKTINQKFDTNPEMLIKPEKDKGNVISNKEGVIALTEDLDKLKNIEVEIELQDADNKKRKNLVNTSSKETSTDIKFRKTIDKEGADIDVGEIEAMRDTVENYEVEESERESNKNIVETWLNSVKKNFPKFPIN